MKTIKYRGAEIHVGCEGTIIRGTCLKCGEKKPRRKFFGGGPLIEKKLGFDAKAYKDRIRRMDDLR